MARKTKLERFNEYVLSKYQIYNSLFLTLPFDNVKNTSLFLPIFSTFCSEGYNSNLSPTDIIDSFFKKYFPDLPTNERLDLLFNFVQFIERQVVLFDAIEDAGFSYVNNMHGRGTLRNVKEEASELKKQKALKDYLNKFKVRLVLTAHPTQFYPGSVLGIITDLSEAIKTDNLDDVKSLLVQLGKTKFFNKKKPTPLDEAVSLIWYLENVFYHSSALIYNYLKQHIYENESINNNIFDFGFWPGGDRDGNPFVTPSISIKTAKELRFSILRNYYRDLRKLKRKITFDKVDIMVSKLERQVYNTLLYPKSDDIITSDELIKELELVKEILIDKHQNIYVLDVDDLINKVKIFGYHFASLDIREDSRIHSSVLNQILDHPKISDYVKNFPSNFFSLNKIEKRKILSKIEGKVPMSMFQESNIVNTLGSIYAIKKIQKSNGEKGCNRYIISNCGSTYNILELFALLRICDWKSPSIDIIPLFETIPDLESSFEIMRKLYSNKDYFSHLKNRSLKQTIMLGFSDGTKDGGYFMANWSIYIAKQRLTEISHEFGVSVSFFDGRGGPPARGGGNTHQFYASLGDKIQSDQIQITIQGQTISSNFGTLDSSQYNLEQLLSSGISNQVFNKEKNDFSKRDRKTMNELAKLSYDKYLEFKSHPQFVPYLEHMSTLKYYAKTNIGSRPSKRGNKEKLNFSDLRAIPFVGSWSQSKQNVPGFFGVGSSLNYFHDKNNFSNVVELYKNSPFFRTLIANSMMSLTKSFFKLTSYMKNDQRFGEFWKIIYNEYKLSKKMILKLTNFDVLMQDQPAGKESIKVRESIVQPLITIQQYALNKIHENYSKDITDSEVYEKLVTRCLFGNINAARNSA
tara:strand:+ start:67387 stop:69966 length:2580 start_codon:yes stop_codon:yes gene_type:complete